MRTPVGFIIFNRPEATQRVFAEIARARPPKLFVIADGPRPHRPGETEKCAATRAVIDRVDWPCEVVKIFSEENMGCGHRPHTGMQQMFEQVEEAIILEDDCLPHPTFFRYCEDLLERYRDDERVMHISGDNFHLGQQQLPGSYAFSCYSLTWGWATWRRAFRHYDRRITSWPTLRNTTWLDDILGDGSAIGHWNGIFDTAHAAGDSTSYWAYQWLFAIWAQRGLSILPNVNLISNIGYGGDATHTNITDDPRAELATAAMTFPLEHPRVVLRDRRVDRVIFERVVRGQEPEALFQRLRMAATDALSPEARKAVAAFKSRLGPLSRL
jgi:hypothetical protein